MRIREQAELREQELEGGWYTEERMASDLGYSKFLEVQLTVYILFYYKLFCR